MNEKAIELNKYQKDAAAIQELDRVEIESPKEINIPYSF